MIFKSMTFLNHEGITKKKKKGFQATAVKHKHCITVNRQTDHVKVLHSMEQHVNYTPSCKPSHHPKCQNTTNNCFFFFSHKINMLFFDAQNIL